MIAMPLFFFFHSSLAADMLNLVDEKCILQLLLFIIKSLYIGHADALCSFHFFLTVCSLSP